jgi:hypothetical protein
LIVGLHPDRIFIRRAPHPGFAFVGGAVCGAFSLSWIFANMRIAMRIAK